MVESHIGDAAAVKPVDRSYRFGAINGLRAYAALWVVLDHALRNAGIEHGPFVATLLDGAKAVRIFVIISGFVITHLILTKSERYDVYIGRRFFRLFPLYVLVCVIGYLFTGLALEYANAVSWAADPQWLEMKRDALGEYQAVHDRLLPHLLAHLTMLHGAIPYEILPFAERTFSGPSWSISLEWQFYLVAPFVIASLFSARACVALLVLALLGSFLYAQGMLGTYGQHSTLPAASSWFAVGIASRLLLDRLRSHPVSPLLASLLLLLVVYSARFTDEDERNAMVLAVWGAFYFYLLWGTAAAATNRVVRLVFAHPAIAWLGERSYSLYLGHSTCLLIVDYAAIHFFPGLDRRGVLALQVPAILISIGVSAVLYRFVEKPSIDLGHKWAALREARTGAVHS